MLAVANWIRDNCRFAATRAEFYRSPEKIKALYDAYLRNLSLGKALYGKLDEEFGLWTPDMKDSSGNPKRNRGFHSFSILNKLGLLRGVKRRPRSRGQTESPPAGPAGAPANPEEVGKPIEHERLGPEQGSPPESPASPPSFPFTMAWLFEGLSPNEIKHVKLLAGRRLSKMRGLPRGTRMNKDPDYARVLSEEVAEFKARKRQRAEGTGKWHSLSAPSGKPETPAVFPIRRPSGRMTKGEAVQLMRDVASWFVSQGKTSPDDAEKAYVEWYRLMTESFFDDETASFYKNYLGSSSPLSALWSMTGASIRGTLKQKAMELKIARDQLREMRARGIPGANGHPVPPEDQWPGIPRWFVNPSQSSLTRKMMSAFFDENMPRSVTVRQEGPDD